MTDSREPERLERALGRAMAAVSPAAWGFTNRTEIVTLDNGDQVVVQSYRRRADAAYRLAEMRRLHKPATEAGIPLPEVRAADLDDEPPWVIYHLLPGVPNPEAGELRPGGARFSQIARTIGQLLAAFRGLPPAGLGLDDPWADPIRLAASAAGWATRLGATDALGILDAVPELFAGRPAVLTHGDFAPVNVLTDGATITGLLDFEAVLLADPLFDPAW
jgi:aminoglycoside phosphotransferase (APT) family kinase protein